MNSFDEVEARAILQMLPGNFLTTLLMIKRSWSLTSLLFVRSTRRLLTCKKSAPSIDLWTSAIWKRQECLMLLILIVIWRVPYDLIFDPFTATSDKLGGLLRSEPVGVTMLISAPVSTRK